MALKTIVLGLGLVASLVGVIAGVLFALSNELALGEITCVEGALSDANSTNCINNVVQDPAGGDCQIGNLGIFNAKYDPACASTTPYAISGLIPVFEGPTTQFPLLFPSQTNLAGISGAPAFTSCDTYFDGSVLSLASGLTNAGLTQGLDSFKQAVKDGFDENIDSIVPTLNTTLENLIAILIGGIEEATSLTFPAGFDEIVPGTGATALDFLGTLAGGNTVAALVQGALNLAIANNLNTTNNLIQTANSGILIGTSSQFTDENKLFLPDAGVFWVTVDSTVLCGGLSISSPCSFADILQGAAPELNDDQLNAALGVILGYEALSSRATLESAAPAGASVQLATFTTTSKLGIPNAAAVEPADIFAIQSAATTLGSVFAVGCGEPCNFVSFLSNQTSAASTAAEQRGLLQILAILQGCAPGPVSSAACFTGFLAAESGQVAALNSVLGSLYGLEDSDLTSLASTNAALAASCKNHEKDLAAIQTAAIVIPTGVGLLGAGMLASVAALALGNKKAIGVIGALVALVGMALVLGGLLSVFFAPVYSSLGSGGAPEDNSIGFALGIGFTYVALLAGAGIVGALMLLVGALLKQPEDASVAIMKP